MCRETQANYQDIIWKAAQQGNARDVDTLLRARPEVQNNSDFMQNLTWSSLRDPMLLRTVLPYTSCNERNEIASAVGALSIPDECKRLFAASLDYTGYDKYLEGRERLVKCVNG